MKHISFHFLLQFFLLSAHSQNMAGGFRVYGREEGLPAGLYHKVFQSSDGFFWIASQSGLLRFDGLQFQAFYSSISDTNSLSDNVVLDIEEDDERNLWLATLHEGVSRLNLNTYTWKRYNRLSNDNSPYFGVFDIYKDSEGILWFGTSGRGLFRYDKKKDSFEKFIPDPHRPHDGSIRFANEIRKIQQDPEDKNILWLAGMEGLYRFHKITKRTDKWQNSKNGFADWKDNCFHSIRIRGNTIWLATWGGGLVAFDKTTTRFVNYTYDTKQYLANNLSKNIITDIHIESDSVLLLTSADIGLLRFNTLKKKYSIVIDEQRYPWLGDFKGLTGITVSRDGALWVAGMNYVYQRNELFRRFGSPVYFPASAGLDERPALWNGIYNTLTGTYWLCTGNGSLVYEYDQSFRLIKTIPFDLPDINDIIVRTIHQTGDGLILAAPDTYPFLCVYDPAKKKFVAVSRLFPSMEWEKQRIFFHAIPGGPHITWLAAKGELLKWDRKKNTVRSFPFGSSPAQYESEKLLPWKMITDQHGNVWIATAKGIFIFNVAREQWTHLHADENKTDKLATNRVTSLVRDNENKIWIAMESQGIQVYDPETGKFINWFHPSNGFLSTHAVHMARDNNGDIWTATRNGLGRYLFKKKIWQWFDRNDGLVRDYLDQPLIAMQDGLMILGMADGFQFFKPDSLKTNTTTSPVYITQVLVNNKELPYHAIHTINHFKSRQNFIEINYTAIDPVFAKRMQFLYSLSGNKDEWTTTTSRKVVFAQLAPGKYTFRVKSVNSDGIDSPYITTFSFVIHPPFWKTGWFIALMICALMGLLYLIYRYLVRQIYRLQELRNNISRNLHDELGSAVSSINMLAVVAKKKLEDEHPAIPLLNQISESAQQAGESIDEIIWSVNPKHDNAAATFSRIRNYHSQLLESAGIAYEIHIENTHSAPNLNMELRRDIWLICKEAVNNLVKYAACTKAVIHIEYKNQAYYIEIKDNGTGFDVQKALESQRNGLKNMKARVVKYRGGFFNITSAAGKGTVVRCILPANHSPKM